MAVFRISEKYQLENRNFKNRKFQNTSTLLSSTFLLLRPFLSDSCFVGKLRCANLAERHKAGANNGEGWKTAFRKENKSLISPDSRIRRGLGTGTVIILYKLLASLLCPELNLINI